MKNFTGEEVDSILEKDREEQEREKTDKIKEVYGDLIQDDNRPKKHHVYIFTPEDLDDDNVIFNVEESPTYSRDKITAKNMGLKPVEKQEQDNNTPIVPQSNTIEF